MALSLSFTRVEREGATLHSGTVVQWLSLSLSLALSRQYLAGAGLATRQYMSVDQYSCFWKWFLRGLLLSFRGTFALTFAQHV